MIIDQSGRRYPVNLKSFAFRLLKNHKHKNLQKMDEESRLETKVDLVMNLQEGNLEKALQIAQVLQKESHPGNPTVKEMIRLKESGPTL